MSQNIDFDRLKYSLTGEYEEVVLDLDHDERIERKQIDHILEILDKEVK